MTEPALGAGDTGEPGDTSSAPSASQSHWPNELDAEYELIGEVGRGGMAVVYRARDRELGRDVAIKVVRPRFATDDEAVARLVREARTVAQLQHPNIVGLYAVRHLSDRTVALVMQLVPGRTLKAALDQEGPFDPARTEHVLRDITRALAYAHEAGVVHRDVKPENIFLDDVSGRAMLSDFGVARVMDAPSELTATGTTIGTPTYMPPEQIDGAAVDGRSDLYSLGMVGWEMLTGQRPWAGESLYGVIYRQKHDPLPPIDSFRSDVPPQLQYLLEGTMQKAPDRRWSSAQRFLALLSSDKSPPGLREWQAAQRRRRRTGVYQQSRARGASVVQAAIETMKLKRGDAAAALGEEERRRSEEGGSRAEREPSQGFDATMPVVSPSPGAPDSPRALIERAMAAPTGAPVVHIAPPPRQWLWAGLVAVVVVAMLIVGIRMSLSGGVATQPPPAPQGVVAKDRPGVEVPVIPSVVIGPRLDSASDTAAGVASSGTVKDTSARQRVASTPNAGRSGATTSTTAPAGAARADTGTGRASSRNTDRASTRERPNAPPNTRTSEPTSSSRTAPGAGRGTTTSPSPLPAPLPAAPVVAPAPAPSSLAFPIERGLIAAGSRHSCMIAETGRATCWGNNDAGQLGDGSFETRSRPGGVAGDFLFAQLAAGTWHSCGLTSGGDVYCWGKNDSGQLGDGTTSERSAPVRVNSASAFRVVRAGNAHTCALTRAGAVYCWGANAYGQLGDGSRTSRASPVAVSLPAPAGALTVGSNHTCAITSDGSAYCWGQNRGGQLGDGTTTDHALPTAVDSDQRFVSIAAGASHTCGVNTSGAAYCWGQNSYGQLGAGVAGGSTLSPRAVETTVSFATVVAGSAHTCARARDGRAWCWGRNVYGQIGDGTTTDRVRPVAVGVPSLVALHAGAAHTCGVTASGEAYCWGYNIDGQLGVGDRENAAAPARVTPSR